MDLALAWRDRRIAQAMTPFSSGQTPVRFLDYVIDGESLYEQHGFDYIGPLGWGPHERDEEVARRLLLESGPDMNDRVAVYVCPECGDLLCGAITAMIELGGDEIVWRDLATSAYDYDDGTWHHDATGLERWSELRFPAPSYRDAITNRPKTGFVSA
jgi:hypothetical protein